MTPPTYTLYSEQKPKPEDFPIVLRYNDWITNLYICKTVEAFERYSAPTHWAPFREPAMPPEPKKTPFEEWKAKQHAPFADSYIFSGGAEYGRSEERKRFLALIEGARIRGFPGRDCIPIEELRAFVDGKEL